MAEIRWSEEDVRRLYGDYLFVLPEGTPEAAPAAAAEPEAPSEPTRTPEPAAVTTPPVADRLQRGEKVQWKMKADSRIALVLTQSDFGNKELTGLLKQSILQAKIPTEWVGFGIIADEAEVCDLSDMPVEVALLCQHLPDADAAPVGLGTKQVFVCGRLEGLQDSTRRQELMFTLAQAKSLL